MNITTITRAAILICFGAMIWACTKESNTLQDVNEQEPISVVPEIALQDVEPTSVVQYQDSIRFGISYIDGDGDLGHEDPDVKSIELTDNRQPENFIFHYHLSPRTPEGSTISIQGTLDIILASTILEDQNNEEEVTTFSIRLQDRAGNWSNVVETENITIRK